MTALEHRFVCPLPNGLHARPASHLEAVASRFAGAEVALVNERSGVEANAKSVLSLVGADVHHGDPLRLRVRGAEAEPAFAALTRFLREEFPRCDAPLPDLPPTEGQPLPRALAAAAPEGVLRGTAVSRGVGQGGVVRVGTLRLAEGFVTLRPEGDGEEGLDLFQAAVAVVHADLAKEIAAARGPQAEVLRAHAALLRDVSLAEAVARHYRVATGAPGGGVAHAILAAVEEFSASLRRSTSAYLQERVLDLQDVGARLLAEIHGPGAVAAGPTLDGPALVVAEGLTPGQFLALDRRFLRGLILQHAGTTSHTVILARSFGVPALTGVAAATLAEGTEAILDADLGLLLPQPNVAVRRYYTLESRRTERAALRARAFLAPPTETRDGHRLPVLANVSSAEEVIAAVAQGAEGVGLFRTEMLFMDRETPPSEDEQTAVYAAAVRAAAGRPVTLRTFDIGGDKPVPYLHLPAEANPFLGQRGARLYEEFDALLRTQLRAMFRAAAHGPVRVMAPMIACPEEMRAFRAVANAVRAEFPAADVPVGMMIEVPAAAFALEELASHADFFSLGTNDLAQYFLAADRDNAGVAALYSAFHPAFLRLLRQVVDTAHAHGRTVGLCGELAENAATLPALLGLGVDSLSVGPPRVLATKAALTALDARIARKQFRQLLACPDRVAVETQLARFRADVPPRPLLAGELIELAPFGRTKHEVIKELADVLGADGRTREPAAVEEAVWQREQTYSTGFGHGFAMPHCQSEHVQANSCALARLAEPVDWDSVDGQPVRVVILLALRAEDRGREHLRILSRLSRLVMREEFRAGLETAADADAVLRFLATELDLPPLPVHA